MKVSARNATHQGAVTKRACRRGEILPAYMWERVHGHFTKEQENIGEMQT